MNFGWFSTTAGSNDHPLKNSIIIFNGNSRNTLIRLVFVYLNPKRSTRRRKSNIVKSSRDIFHSKTIVVAVVHQTLRDLAIFLETKLFKSEISMSRTEWKFPFCFHTEQWISVQPSIVFRLFIVTTAQRQILIINANGINLRTFYDPIWVPRTAPNTTLSFGRSIKHVWEFIFGSSVTFGVQPISWLLELHFWITLHILNYTFIISHWNPRRCHRKENNNGEISRWMT